MRIGGRIYVYNNPQLKDGGAFPLLGSVGAGIEVISNSRLLSMDLPALGVVQGLSYHSNSGNTTDTPSTPVSKPAVRL